MNGKTFVLIILALTVLRAAWVSFEEISPTEAYYAMCARHPAPAYFDGPPGTAILAAVGEIGGAPDWVWRWWAPLWALLASLACYLLVRALDNERRAARAALALNALPLFNADAVRVGPELPALTFVLLGLWGVWRALQAERGAPGSWLGGAAAFALAAQFSYLALWTLPGVALHTLCSRKHHRGRNYLGLVLVFLVPFAALGPALAWNAAYEWVPFFSGTFRSLWEFSLAGLGAALVRLVGQFSPLVPVLFLLAWIVALRQSRVHLRARFVALGTLPLVVLTVYSAWRDGHPRFFLLLAAPLLIYAVFVWMENRPWVRTLWMAAIGLAVIFSGWSVYRAHEDGRGWSEAATELKEAFSEHSEAGHEGVFLIAGDAPLASVMGWYLRNDLVPPEGHPTVYERESQGISSQFGLWPSYDDFIESNRVVDEYFTEQKGENLFVGRSALYLTRESPENLPQAIQGAFEAVKLLQEIRPPGRGEPLYLYFCLNYQTLPL
jgi:4-amino-4-deoxy-L-arabinose transferase and related glycosyltransferases of PMT family